MPATEYHRYSFLTRSIMSMRRNLAASIEPKYEQEMIQDLEHFHKHVADSLQDLSFSGGEDDSYEHYHHQQHLALDLPWLRKLLDAFLSCEEEFNAVLLQNPTKSQFLHNRLFSDLLDRSLKALDICNAVSLALDSLRRSHQLARLALSALRHKPLGPGQLRRATKALKTVLTTLSLHDADSNASPAERAWSFGRKSKSSGNLDSSSSWSAAKQLQAMAWNLAPPRGAEMGGLALPIYTMSTGLVFVTWALVAAVPCQDRLGLAAHLPPPPRQLPWAAPLIGLQERIAEDWRKKEKTGKAGLMEELQRLERCADGIIGLGDSQHFPMEAERAEELRAQVDDLAEICNSMEEELVPFQQQVREVFQRIARSRTEVLDYMAQA